MRPAPRYVKLNPNTYINPQTGQTISRRQYLNLQRGVNIEVYRNERANFTKQTESLLIAYGVAGSLAAAAAAAYTRARTPGGEVRALRGTGVSREQLEALRVAVNKQEAGEPLTKSEYTLLSNLGLLAS